MKTKIRQLPLIAALLLLIGLTSRPAFGEVINLVCQNTTGRTVNLRIDTQLKTVLMQNMRPARDVYIDEEVINFIVDLDNSWSHTIDRSTGTLSIHDLRNKGITISYSCERAKQKF